MAINGSVVSQHLLAEGNKSAVAVHRETPTLSQRVISDLNENINCKVTRRPWGVRDSLALGEVFLLLSESSFYVYRS